MPRLEDASSCTSSTITYRTVRMLFFMRLPMKIACTVSGVVMSTSGGFRACFLRSCMVVSPCLTSMDMSSALDHSFRRFIMSRLSARSGVIYSTFMPSGPLSCKSPCSAGSMADSVLPVPVGAINNTFSRERIAGIAFSCVSVGFENPMPCKTVRILGSSNSKEGFHPSTTKCPFIR